MCTGLTGTSLSILVASKCYNVSLVRIISLDYHVFNCNFILMLNTVCVFKGIYSSLYLVFLCHATTGANWSTTKTIFNSTPPTPWCHVSSY